MADTSDKAPQPIHPEWFLRQVEKLHVRYMRDPEVFHAKTDKLMEEVLISLGYEAGVKALRGGKRWYA